MAMMHSLHGSRFFDCREKSPSDDPLLSMRMARVMPALRVDAAVDPTNPIA